MGKSKSSVKVKYNWPMTILLIALAVVFILGPLYIAVLIAIKDPSEMANVLSFPKKLRLQNFADAWVMTDYPRKFMNTLFITVVNLIFTILTNSMVAYAITRNKDKNKLFSLAYYYFVSAMFIPFNVIMLPLMKPMSATVAILSFMWTWNDFSMPLVLLSEEKYQTLQLAQYVFKGQFNTEYNLAFASYLLVLLPILLVYVFCQKWIIEGVTNGAVKA